MGILDSIKALFAAGGPPPPDAKRLDGGSESALAQSLQALHPGERAWITFSEARALFSTADRQYAFGETDEAGSQRIAAFAAQGDPAARVEFMPAEGRVYFVRKAS